MVDFSKKAIQKEVSGRIIQHPVSLLPTALGGLGLAAFLLGLIGFGPLFMLAGAFVTFGLGSLGVNFLRRGAIENSYIHKLTALLEQEKQKRQKELVKKLEIINNIQDLKLYSKQAGQQYDMIADKFCRFKAMLKDKFNPAELTYGRLLGTVEQLYLSVLDNLEQIVLMLDSASTIDPSYIGSRLAHLNALSQPEQADLDEIETLKKRSLLRQEQLSKINILLTKNEQAMTEIDISMSGIAQAQTQYGRASVDMEIAREELAKLIEKTKQFSLKKEG